MKQDKLRGWSRLLPAFANSVAGFKTAWSEPAFFMEVWFVVLMFPFAFLLGQDWLQITFLISILVLVPLVELINTGIESAIDRVGLEWHEMSKRAKDLGSAAVFLSIMLCGGVWVSAIFVYWQRLS